MAETHAIAHPTDHADEHAAHDDHGHGPEDPNASPLRGDVRDTFSTGAIAFCAVLGLVAIVAGTVIGLTVINN